MKRWSRSRLAWQIAAPLVAGTLAVIATRPDVGGAAETAPFTLGSPAFTDHGPIPPRFTADGLNLSPPLAWRRPPAETRQLALVMEDIDRGESPWAHWVIYNVPTRTPDLPPGLPREAMLQSPVRAAQGANAWPEDNLGYRGPEAPPDEPHRYRFRVYALGAKLDLPPGLTRDQLLRRLDGHVLATADLIGTYER